MGALRPEELSAHPARPRRRSSAVRLADAVFRFQNGVRRGQRVPDPVAGRGRCCGVSGATTS
jgi:hypothetical protein